MGDKKLELDDRMAALERSGQAVSRTMQNEREISRIQAWRDLAAGKQPENAFN